MPYVGKKPADIIATAVDSTTGDFSGNVTAGGTLGVTGAVTANAGVVVDNITIDGTEIDLSSGSLTVDVATDITLDAGGGNVILKDDGTSYMTFTNIDGTNVSLVGNLSGNLTLNVAGKIILDADSTGSVEFHDGGTKYGTISTVSNHMYITSAISDADIIFQGNDGGTGIEAARFDMSGAGSLLVGKANTTAGVTGLELETSGTIVSTRDGNVNIFLNRTSSDGEMIELRRDNSTLGKIGILTGDMQLFSTTSNHGGFTFGNGNINPCSNTGAQTDNAMDLGASSVRYQDVFAANGVTTTSDRNEKQDIEELTDAEKKVAVACKGLLRKYRWKDAVAKKGDKARTHFGIIAQDLQDAFTAESLDASKYAMFCSDTWWEKEITVDAVEAVEEVKDEEGNVTTEAVEAKDAYTYMDNKYEATDGYTEKTRLGVRYNELLAFIISAI